MGIGNNKKGKQSILNSSSYLTCKSEQFFSLKRLKKSDQVDPVYLTAFFPAIWSPTKLIPRLFHLYLALTDKIRQTINGIPGKR